MNIMPSALTGEANPVEKNVGDQVFSGTLNLWGAVEFDVVRLPAESTLQKIIRLIQTAQKLKAPSERFTDRFGTGYTYAVIGGSLLMFLIWWLGFHLPPFENTPEVHNVVVCTLSIVLCVVLTAKFAIFSWVA